MHLSRLDKLGLNFGSRIILDKLFFKDTPDNINQLKAHRVTVSSTYNLVPKYGPAINHNVYMSHH